MVTATDVGSLSGPGNQCDRGVGTVSTDARQSGSRRETESGAVERTRGDRTPATTGDGVDAELHLDHDRLLLRPTLRSLDDVSVTPEYRAQNDGVQYQFVTVRGSQPETVLSAFDRDPTVRNPVCVDRTGERIAYRLEVTDQAVSLSGPIAEQGGRVLDADGTSSAWVVHLQFPSRDALVAFNDACKDRDISVQVTQLRSSGDEAKPVLGLTAKQQRLLSIAYELGYFDVPRGISQDELAAKLGVSKSAISQRLRRAMTELCATSLSAPVGPAPNGD